MKYIRTKDGIYEHDLRTFPINDGKTLIINQGVDRASLLEDIIKQANTIEELCDELVVICDKAFTKPMLYDTKDIGMLIKDVIYSFKSYHWEYQVYGAIWTDKGLIFVARMNSKGELELL